MHYLTLLILVNLDVYHQQSNAQKVKKYKLLIVNRQKAAL